MKVAVSPTAPAVPALSQRLADYVELTKPRIAVMVLVTVAAGYLMAAGVNAKLVPLLHTLIGTALVTARGGIVALSIPDAGLPGMRAEGLQLAVVAVEC